MKNIQEISTARGNVSRNGWWVSLSLLFILLVSTSCSGGGTTLAGGGIGGTGVTSFGPITALGSIYVNDIEFETTSSTVILDGMNSDESQLQVGMVVKVEGTVNADGRTGIANVVTFDDNVEGPVSTIDVAGNTLQVMGQTVLVDEQTVFAGLPSPWSLADLAADDLVEVSGLQDVDGNIKATRLYLKTGSEPSEVEVSGPVSNLDLIGSSFTINALTIDYSNADLKNFGSLTIQQGDMVEVKGTFTQAVLVADSVERKSVEFNNDDALEIEGFIHSLSFEGHMISGFTMVTPAGNLQIRISDETRFMGGHLGDIKIGARVEVEGIIQNDIIQAEKVEFADDIKIEAVVTNPDSANLTVGFADLSALTVTIDHHAELEDERTNPVNATDPADFIDSIQDGDLIAAKGRIQMDGHLIISDVELLDPPQDASQVIIQGPLQTSPQDPFLQILGVTIDTGRAVQFLDGDENTVSRSAFFASLTQGTLVNVEGILTADNRIDGVVLQIAQND
jgi:hypothetical protein